MKLAHTITVAAESTMPTDFCA